MPVAMTVEELERFFLAEFPRSFYPESGLTIEAVWERGCRVRQAFRQRSVRPGGTISGPTMMALAARHRRGHHLLARRDGARCPRHLDVFDPARRGRGIIRPLR